MHPAASAFLARFEGLKARLPGDPDTREAAKRDFAALGFPGRHLEAWKYTSLSALTELNFAEPLTDCSDIDPARAPKFLDLLPRLDLPRLVFLDGRYRKDLSLLPLLGQYNHFAAVPRFLRLYPGGLEALNTMLAEDGAVIDLPEGLAGGTVVLVSIGQGASNRPVAFHPRHRIRLARGASLELIEIAVGNSVYLHQPVFEIEVAEGAHLTHLRVQNESPAAFHLSAIHASVGRDATYDSFTLTLGARLARANIDVLLAGERATAHLNAAQLLGGTQHGDFTTCVRHAEKFGASRQTVKNVLAGSSRAVFQGRIEVARGADKTDGYQMNHALLLSPDAEIDSKPELEIFADDVKCSHGAAVGALDEEQLFYLRSRGIDPATARAMLVQAFLAEALEQILLDETSEEAVRAYLDELIAAGFARITP